MDGAALNLKTYPVGHLPVVRAVMEQLGVLDVLDELLPIHPLSHVSDAHCVTAMVLNILSGRMALFRMDSWLQRSDTELLLGPGCEPAFFNDTRLALALDHLDAVGTDRVMGGVVERYLGSDDRPTSYTVHTDTTSFSLWGAYEGETEPNVTFGFSKAKRPDLKQLILGLSLHGAVGMPLVCSVTSGNTSDQRSNRDHVARLAKLLPSSDEVTVVADCKLVDADTIGRVLSSGFHFVSLVPDTFNLREQLIQQAWASEPDLGAWPELVREPGRTKATPDRVYRGWSVERTFPVLLRKDGDGDGDGDGGPVPSTQNMRFLVVQSANLASRFKKSLPSKLKKERDLLERFAKRVGRKGFDCKADALRAAAEVMAKLKLHQVEVQALPEVRQLKRTKRGRPKAGEQAPTETRWVVRFNPQVDEAAVEAARRKNSCFVLITDKLDDGEGPSDVDILSEYRHQYLVENHTGFRWLKSEGQVSPMFLKTPSRIRAMGLVLVLALMVRNFIQFTLRRALKVREETLPHPFTRQRVNNLTTEMAMAWFDEVVVVHASLGDAPLLRQPPKLRGPACRILDLLGISMDVFARPPPARPGGLARP